MTQLQNEATHKRLDAHERLLDAHERRLDAHLVKNTWAADELRGMSGRLDAVGDHLTVQDETIKSIRGKATYEEGFLREALASHFVRIEGQEKAILDLQQRGAHRTNRLDAQLRVDEDQEEAIQDLRAQVAILRGLLEVSNDRHERVISALTQRLDQEQQARLVLETQCGDIEDNHVELEGEVKGLEEGLYRSNKIRAELKDHVDAIGSDVSNKLVEMGEWIRGVESAACNANNRGINAQNRIAALESVATWASMPNPILDLIQRVEKLEILEACGGIQAAPVHEDPAIQFQGVEVRLLETLRKEFNGYIGERVSRHSKALRKNIDSLDSQVHILRKDINGLLFDKHEVAKRVNEVFQAVRDLQVGWNKMIPDVVALGEDRLRVKEAIEGQVGMLQDLNERLCDVEQDVGGLMDDFYTEIPDGVSLEEFAAEMVANDPDLCDQAEPEAPAEHPLVQLMRELPGTMEYVVRLVGASPVDAQHLLNGTVTDNLRERAKHFKAFTFKE